MVGGQWQLVLISRMPVHLEWASMTTRNIFPSMGASKSTYVYVILLNVMWATPRGVMGWLENISTPNAGSGQTPALVLLCPQ